MPKFEVWHMYSSLETCEVVEAANEDEAKNKARCIGELLQGRGVESWSCLVEVEVGEEGEAENED